jgi:hypothetical protein
MENTVSKRIAVQSHLSDAMQELVSLPCNTQDEEDMIRRIYNRIRLVKFMVNNSASEFTEEELDAIWNTLMAGSKVQG